MALTRKNPVHGVLWLLLLFLHVAVVYLFLNAEFLGMVQVIVYAGAILVMFLFTIFFLDIKIMPKERRIAKLWEGRLVIGLSFLAVMVLVFSSISPTYKGKHTISYVESVGNTRIIGEILFNEYGLGVLLLGLILLVPMISVVILGRRKA